VDEPKDLSVVRKIFQSFSPRIDFSWKEVMKRMQRNRALFEENGKIRRNEGAVLGTGQKLWKRAKRVIPGGNMLLSKRAEMFLPDHWPTYFSRAKGCHVWDLDGKKYIDMSIMGIGTNILGYGHPAVDEAVQQVVRKGNMSTLNCPEEVYLAEKLVELHPWAEMVRLARTGGEANAIAIRIARAASGKEKVAVCGYHGWHDWYLSANLADDHNLDGHLLPGLEPKGVPRNLKRTVFPFRYNRYEDLENLVKREGIGIVKMEVERNEPPKPGYLKKIRKLCSDRGIVLIFDECTSGFRETFGGLHKKYGVEPDMAMFGKALGNGYAITAVIGRRKIMEATQSTFISSTFWGERIGPAAALKTLEVMAAERSWERITTKGREIARDWHCLAKKHGLKIQTGGLPALTGFTFETGPNQIYKTLITQEMLSRGYLAATSVYISLAHTSSLFRGYVAALDKVFGLIKKCEEGARPSDFLKGLVAQSGFRRLN
jgi:glutamate-1-semialdehyde 2,1-aminomutase